MLRYCDFNKNSYQILHLNLKYQILNRVPKKKQRLFMPDAYDQLEHETIYPLVTETTGHYGKPTPIPPPFDLNAFDTRPTRPATYDSLAASRDSSQTSSSIRFVDDSSVCSSEITLSGDSVRTSTSSNSSASNAPIRPRRASLPSTALGQLKPLLALPIIEIEPACQLTPSAKPRVNNLPTVTNSSSFRGSGTSTTKSNREILDDLSR